VVDQCAIPAKVGRRRRVLSNTFVGREFASTKQVRLEQETFGPVLRAARERRGVTLRQLSVETKLSVELWEALEENNLSRWPKRVFARSYVRDYALRVGLDADEVVNEFCRLFPEWGDRRAEHVIRGKAEIIAHDLSWEDPTREQRRAADRVVSTAPGFVARHGTRMVAVAMDLSVIVACGLCGVRLGFGYWSSVAVASATYSALATALVGRSFGLAASEWMVRTLKAVPGTRRLLSSRTESA
jgi:transcriptional regulator with XRE-family HTH domain